MATEDLYNVLGISRTASKDDIRKAYRAQARKYHPDLNKDPGAEETFKKIQAAYEVLSDPEARARYDRGGLDALRGGRRARSQDGSVHFTWSNDRSGPAGTGRGAGFEGFFNDEDDISSVLDAFFGGRRKSRSAHKPDKRAQKSSAATSSPPPTPEAHRLTVPFMTVARGGKESLLLAGTRPDGSMWRKTIRVRIPAGVPEGQQLRIRDDDAGEVLIEIHSTQHSLFHRDTDRARPLDVVLDLPLTIVEAMLGARVSVPTLDGAVDLTVPPDTLAGARLRLKGRGIRDAEGNVGDMYAVVRTVLPDRSTITEAEAETLRHICERNDSPRIGDDWPDVSSVTGTE